MPWTNVAGDKSLRLATIPGQSLMLYVYPILSWLTLAAPLVALGIALISVRRTGRMRPFRAFLRTVTTGGILGGAVASLYASIAGARIPLGQVTLACYLGAAAMCVAFGINWLIFQVTSRLFRLHSVNRSPDRRRAAQAGAGAVQSLLLIAIGLPYLGSVLFLYRPCAPSSGTPPTLIGASTYQVVDLRATDGTRLEGWWIPATRTADTDGRGSVKWGRDTVLFCPGFGADKAGQLFLARDLMANGYNVLAIDLRAHGRSGGQFTGMGGLESRDVLGAIAWLRRMHPAECHRILGLGESLGAVALIEAASDPGPDGQAIDAIAAYNPYADLRDEMNEVASQHVISAGQWALRHVIIPFASAEVGCDLSEVSPRLAIRMLWPRPLLVIGNPTSPQVGGKGSFDLFQGALQPRYGYFPDAADRDALLHDHVAALTVRIFFDEERSVL